MLDVQLGVEPGGLEVSGCRTARPTTGRGVSGRRTSPREVAALRLARGVERPALMFASFPSASLFGVDAFQVDVEVDVSGGLPGYHVVGLPAASVREGATRLRAALKNCGHDLPARKITVNLAPADRRKDGAAFDLPIALALVVAAGVFLPDALAGLLVVGELGLDGGVRPVRGVLAAASLARRQGHRGIVVPRSCAAEAAVVRGLEIIPVDHLADVLRALDGTASLPT